jgi:hypothetical protein
MSMGGTKVWEICKRVRDARIRSSGLSTHTTGIRAIDLFIS